MSNLSESMRNEILNYLDELKLKFNDDENIITINKIETALNDKKYGLVWEEHSEEVEEILEKKIPVFTEVIEKKIEVNSSQSYNFIIEGDNLHSLKLLQKTHKGKIDVIYIDPPYNTGAKNWRYNNDFVDANDGFKHSKFISFLYKRLNLAKNLLSEEGIIIVTIDDYEFHNVKHIMNEIYGEEQYIGNIVIKNNPSGRSTVSGLSVCHEYALLYGKKQNVKLGRLDRSEKQIARYKEMDDIGFFEWVNFRKHGGYREDAPTMYYPIYIKKDGSDFRIPKMEWSEKLKEYIVHESVENDEFVSYPIDDNGRARRWKWGLERAIEMQDEMSIRLDQRKNFSVYIKSRMKDEGMLPLSVWDNKKYSSTEYGNNYLSSILGGKKFDYPKSVYAVIDCLKVANTKKDSIILDFFAGSGTTGHAVMKMNELDHGNRKFILCTNNENDICEEVTYERIKKTSLGYEHVGKYEEELFSSKLTITNLRKMDEILSDIETIKKLREDDFEKFITKSENGILTLSGINQKTDNISGIPHNIKYFKTEFIPKVDNDEEILSEKLLPHIKEMVELENMCEVDGKHKVILLTESELLNWATEEIIESATVYLPSSVLVSREIEEKARRNKVNFIDIPDYYFIDELREVKEL